MEKGSSSPAKKAPKPVPEKAEEVKAIDGHPISSSSVRRLERDLKILQEQYDTLRIKQLTHHATESDPAKIKADVSKMNAYKSEIKKKEELILKIKLSLKD